jgi:hypothetical protein
MALYFLVVRGMFPVYVFLEWNHETTTINSVFFEIVSYK